MRKNDTPNRRGSMEFRASALVILRNANNLSVAALASAINKSTQTIRNWESGATCPTATDLALLAGALDVEIAELFGVAR